LLTAKQDGDTPSWSPANPVNQSTSVIDFGGQLDQTNPYGETCPADQTFAVMGQTLTLSWSTMCGALALVGKAVLAFAFMGAAFIVFKS
jgi:hypothetical protein